MELAGELDLQGFLALNDAIRPGYQKIRGRVKIKSDADPETLEKLRQAVNAHCPVLDIISNPVPLWSSSSSTKRPRMPSACHRPDNIGLLSRRHSMRFQSFA